MKKLKWMIIFFLLMTCSKKDKVPEIRGIEFRPASYSEIFSEAKQQNKLVLLDFYSPT